MNPARKYIWAVPLLVVGCSATHHPDTLATLRHRDMEIRQETIEYGLDKAMASYERFVRENPDSPLTAEAIRRLADLRLEKEYGALTAVKAAADSTGEPSALTDRMPGEGIPSDGQWSGRRSDDVAVSDISGEAPDGQSFTERVPEPGVTGPGRVSGTASDLERAGTREAIELYKRLLHDHPEYEHNDQVLYQMSRAYEELGETEEAMRIMERMVRDLPRSRYIDEVQFRRAEYFFVHRRFIDAEEAYGRVVTMGDRSTFYELALYKLGWTFYKQELYEDALQRFIALMDYKLSSGYDFEQVEDEQEGKRIEDTLRVISLSFSNLGGPESVVEYFAQQGKRPYEDKVYRNLGEFYLDKRRYADAAATYNAFVARNPYHRAAPNFHMRVIEIQSAGGFPSLVLESKKQFAAAYGLTAEYWRYFEPENRPDVQEYLKINLNDLASYYHASYQDPHQEEGRQENFKEALHWYRERLASFPTESDSPVMNYQLAELLLENGSLVAAAGEFERTAYDYAPHERAAEAGFAAVAAYREQLGKIRPEGEEQVKRAVIRSSLKFSEMFPEHEKAAIVHGAAVDDLYALKEYEQALTSANRLLEVYPDSDADVLRSAWLVSAHASFELARYQDAENAYIQVTQLLPEGDETLDSLNDNLAASIYKQGEEANTAADYRAAADHFLRVGRMAPTSEIRANAEFDAAVALIQLQEWEAAISVLEQFRTLFPEHSLQQDVTKKLAYVYKENNRLSLAAREFERIERESNEVEIRMEALQVAADLYEMDGDSRRALEVYQRYVEYFPEPIEMNLEIRNKMAVILKRRNDDRAYLDQLERIVAGEASAGSERTPRTRYLAAQAALVLAEREFTAFEDVELVQPFEMNLKKKRERMKAATAKFNALLEYEMGETTAAATYYLAEIYAHFSKALMTSERPEELNPMELEQYELAIEEQAYPFEEKAIEVHENNLKLISRGIYNIWVERSLQKLAVFMPARYDKPEESGGVISSLETFIYEIERSTPQSVAQEDNATDGGLTPPEETADIPGPEVGEASKPRDDAMVQGAKESVESAEAGNDVPAGLPAETLETGVAAGASETADESHLGGEAETIEMPEVTGLVQETGTVEPFEESGKPTGPDTVETMEEVDSRTLPGPQKLEEGAEAGNLPPASVPADTRETGMGESERKPAAEIDQISETGTTERGEETESTKEAATLGTPDEEPVMPAPDPVETSEINNDGAAPGPTEPEEGGETGNESPGVGPVETETTGGIPESAESVDRIGMPENTELGADPDTPRETPGNMALPAESQGTTGTRGIDAPEEDIEGAPFKGSGPETETKAGTIGRDAEGAVEIPAGHAPRFLETEKSALTGATAL